MIGKERTDEEYALLELLLSLEPSHKVQCPSAVQRVILNGILGNLRLGRWPGQQADVMQALPWVDAIRVIGRPGQPPKRLVATGERKPMLVNRCVTTCVRAVHTRSLRIDATEMGSIRHGPVMLTGKPLGEEISWRQ